MTFSKEQGGLGNKDVGAFNLSLLCKWLGDWGQGMMGCGRSLSDRGIIAGGEFGT